MKVAKIPAFLHYSNMAVFPSVEKRVITKIANVKLINYLTAKLVENDIFEWIKE